MEREWEILFNKYDLRAVLRAEREKRQPAVLEIPADRFEQEDDVVMAAYVASKLVVSPIRLDKSAITVSSREAKIDVRHDPNRFFHDMSVPHFADGLEVTYHVPFTGDRELLYCRPSSYTLNPPRAVVETRELTFPIDAPDRDVAATKARFESALAAVEGYLGNLAPDLEDHNSSLQTEMIGLVQARRRDLAKVKTDLSALGFPVKGESPTTQQGQTTVNVAALRAAHRTKESRKFDVALSFAGEDRSYVEQVANELKTLSVEVFYDRFEQVDLWGSDLAEHFGQVYSQDAHFVVIFSSHSYAAKAWPNHEKQFALSRHLKGEQGRILPVRLDDTEVPGIPPTLGYLDGRAINPTELARVIRVKIDQRIPRP